MFADETCHGEDHPHQAVFSLAVLPQAQRQGVGPTHRDRRGKSWMLFIVRLLLCPQGAVPYYAS